MRSSRKGSQKLFWIYLLVFTVAVAVGGSFLGKQKMPEQQVPLRQSQTRGEVKPTDEPWRFTPFIVDFICSAGETQIPLYKRVGNLRGLARESHRLFLPGPSMLTIAIAQSSTDRAPRIMLYNDENQPIASGTDIRVPESGLYRLQTDYYFEDVTQVDLAVSASGNASFEDYVRKHLKTIDLRMDQEQLAVIDRMRETQKEVLAKVKDSAMRGVSLPSPRGRAMARIKSANGEWALASVGIAGRAHAHLTGNALPSLDVRVTAGRLPYGLTRFKLYGLQSKSFGRDMVFETLLEDFGHFMPREDLILVTLNGEIMAYTQMLERIDTHAYEYARVLEQQVIGYDTDALAAKANESRFQPRGFYRTKSYPLSSHPEPSDPEFAARIDQLQMTQATSFAMTYTGNHGLNQSDFRWHTNTRTNRIAPMIRDFNSGVSPVTLGYGNPTMMTMKSLMILATMAPNWRPSMPTHASYFVLRQGEQEQNNPFFWWTVLPQTLNWFQSPDNYAQFCAGLSHWEQPWNRQRVKQRLANFAKATRAIPALGGQIDSRMPVITQDSISAQAFHKGVGMAATSANDPASTYLKTILAEVSDGIATPSPHSLGMFKWRNDTLRALLNTKLQSLPAAQRNAGIAGNVGGPIITFLYREEEAATSHLIFMQRSPGAQTSFSLVDEDGQEYQPTAVRDVGTQARTIQHFSIYVNDIVPDEKLRLFHFAIPRQDGYQYFVSKCASGGAYLGPVEICIDPLHLPETPQPELLSLDALVDGATIEGPVFIPADQTWKVDTPTTITFGPQGHIHIEGRLEIADSAKLTLTAGEGGWGGIHFRNNPDLDIQHLHVENVGHHADTFTAFDGTVYTGAVTFFHTNVTLRDVHLKHMPIEDGLHFLRAGVVLDNVSVSETRGDAIDADYCIVDVSNLRVERAGVLGVDGGDGLDVSGSLVTVRDSQLIACTDKNLSIGENANVTVRNCEFRNAPMGAAAKDASVLDVDGCVFEGNEAAITVYVKKPFYVQPTVVQGEKKTQLTHLGYRPE